MRILLLPGDGIGPEITAATRHVLEAADERFGPRRSSFESRDIGFAALATTGTTLPDDVLERIREVDGTHPRADRPSRLSAARQGRGQRLGRGAGEARPLRQRAAGADARRACRGVGREMDLVIVRECTEGMYPDRNMVLGHAECDADPGRGAFDAQDHPAGLPADRAMGLRAGADPAQTVTAVHKANNFIVTDGLFLEEVRDGGGGLSRRGARRAHRRRDGGLAGARRRRAST